MKHSPSYLEDLAVLARRGMLPSEQGEQLESALQGSAMLRVAAQVGRAFDQVAEVREGDEQRIARAVDRVMARVSAPPVRARRGLRVGLLAALVSISASAMGLVGIRYLPGHEASPAEAVKAAVARPSAVGGAG